MNADMPGVVLVRREVSRYLPATSVFAARGAVGTVIAEEFTRVEVIEDRPGEIVAAASVLVVKDPAALRAALADGRRALDAVAEVRKLVDAAEGGALICAKLDEILRRFEQ